MQIVINVPDKTYEYYVKLANKSDEQLSAYERLILNGTLLPKGHGRLIDADALLKDRHKAIPVIHIIEALTIIEADNESIVLCDSCTHNVGAFSTHCNIDEDGPDPIYDCDFYTKEVNQGW